MKTLHARTPTASQLDDDQVVPDELIGRLYHATESAVLDLLDGFSLQERANLAMFCYRKGHLHRMGLAIAATCDQSTLVAAWGTALGETLFAQSRQSLAEPDPTPGQNRRKITLAKFSTGDCGPAGTLA